jgi:hypothetical protein
LKNDEINKVEIGVDPGSFANLKTAEVCEFVECKNFKNALIDVNYFEGQTIGLELNRPSKVWGIEYLCDQHSGYIQIDNGSQTIQKNMLKSDDFVMKENKTALSMVIFNGVTFDDYSKNITIDTISPNDVKDEIYDKDHGGMRYEDDRETSLKIVSFLYSEEEL